MAGIVKKGKYHGLDVQFIFLFTGKNKKCIYKFVLKKNFESGL